MCECYDRVCDRVCAVCVRVQYVRVCVCVSVCECVCVCMYSVRVCE